jgi:UDP-N-acetylglucosamine/UDP-N-acetylgalactosamine diphosphorylase
MKGKKTSPDAGRGILEQLLKKGVRIPSPESVDIGPDISPKRISGDDVIIHAGCKIYGSKTLIMDGVELGYEAPVTINNCQLGKGVKLNGGFFQESTFLDKVSMGSGAQVREGCLIEEEARGAHNVGLKQTLLFPYVTLGSLVNFCDCLMAGGTDRKNHSEVGSAYIHFNFTPNQDKAAPSLIGDVPRGVMLNQPPIFLGGQGGLVGPVTIEYGTVVAAGDVVRKDVRKRNMMIFSQPSISTSIPFHLGLYSNVKRIITMNTLYIANLIALRRWYLDVRSEFMGNRAMEKALHKGAVERLGKAIEERIQRLGEVAGRMPRSIEIYKDVTGERFSQKTVFRKQQFYERWQDLEQTFRTSLEREGDPSKREQFLKIIEKTIRKNGKNYVRAIKALSERESSVGVSWLQGLVKEISDQAWASLPSLGIKRG